MPNQELGSPLDEISRLERELATQRARADRLEVERDAAVTSYTDLWSRHYLRPEGRVGVA